MSEVVSSLTGAFTLAFVITSMFGLGLGLTARDIVEPLKDVRFLLASLVANFLIVPAAAWTITRIFPLDPDLQVALIVFGAVAGAPLVIKEAELARGNLHEAVSLVTLQLVATVIFLPLALPLLIPGITVDAVAIALPLLLQVLLPLGLGLLMNARYDEEAEMARPIMSDIANLSLALMLILNLRNVGEVLGLLGTGAIGAAILLVIVGFAAGWLLGGPTPASRRTLALGTAQRNFAAAFVVGSGSFGDRPTVMIMLLAASLISMVLLLPAAGELGKRAKAAGLRARAVAGSGTPAVGPSARL
ncbi:MAG TPA: bile acid:sodium symporter [Gemmatimonadales bacterium]|nr:bile acid:sodium symporter [Gemmatimonadales bacterium]